MINHNFKVGDLVLFRPWDEVVNHFSICKDAWDLHAKEPAKIKRIENFTARVECHKVKDSAWAINLNNIVLYQSNKTEILTEDYDSFTY